MSNYYIIKLKTSNNKVKNIKFKLNNTYATKDFVANFKNNKSKIMNNTKNISLNCEKEYILKVLLNIYLQL